MNRILFLIILIFLSNLAIAQIYYTDIQDTVTVIPPDGTDESSNYYYFDINGDDILDYHFRLHHWFVSPGPYNYDANEIYIDGTPNEIAVIGTYPMCPSLFYLGDTIRDSLQWAERAYILVSIPGIGGHYCGNPDNYFGLKLHIENETHFGWIRVTSSQNVVIVREFAYNTTPGAPILAGQTEDFSSIEDIPFEDFKIYSAHGNLYISNTNRQNQINSVRIYNQMGQEVNYHQENGFQVNIDIDQLNSGLYIIKILTEDGIEVRKYFLQ